jgi:hypothetical protein
MAEEMMNEEMTGMAAPAPEATDEPMPAEELTMEEDSSKFDMETLMGNFMDMPQERRQLAARLLASPSAMLFDEIIGEPVMQRLVAQLDKPIEVGAEEPAPESDGMMAPSTEEPMADMPTEDEEATPPV